MRVLCACPQNCGFVQKSLLWQLQRSQVRIAESHARFLHLYRAENLYYHLKHGQELLPQLRQIICLVARLRSLFLLWQLQRSQVRIAESHARFLHLYRAENLYYHLKHGQELLPQLRQIICLVARLRSLFLLWQLQRSQVRIAESHARFLQVGVSRIQATTLPFIATHYMRVHTRTYAHTISLYMNYKSAMYKSQPQN